MSRPARPDTVELALLHRGAPLHVDTYRRARVSPRVRAVLLLLFFLGPLELWTAALAMVAFGFDIGATIGVASAGFGLALFVAMDLSAWRDLGRRAWRSLWRNEALHLGETAGSHVLLPRELTGHVTYPLVIPHGRGWALNLASPRLTGSVRDGDGRVRRFAEVAGERRVLPLTATLRARVDLGDYHILVGQTELPARPARQVVGSDGLRESAFVAASFALHAGLMTLLVYAQPSDDLQIRRSPSALVARLAAVESTLREEEEEKEEQEQEELKREELEESRFSESESIGERAPADAKEAALDAVPRVAERVPEPLRHVKRSRPDRRTSLRIARSTSERMAPEQTLAALTGLRIRAPGDRMGPRVISGPGGPDGEPGSGAFQPGDIYGPDGEPARPTSMLPIGIPGEPRRKITVTHRPTFKGPTVTVVDTTPHVTNEEGLPAWLVKKYIRRQKGTIVHCYKRSVQRDPSLSGKVALSWTIMPDGKVRLPKILRSTLGDTPTEDCMRRRLALWRFPRTKDGTAIRVSYRMHLRTR